MIFSVQNSNLVYSVEFLPDLVREIVSGIFLAQVEVWHMVEVMRRISTNIICASTDHREPTWIDANDGGSVRAC